MATTLPTLDEILSRHGLEKKHLERKIPAEMILEIAPLLDDWKMTGYYLGFTKQDLDDIEIDNPNQDHRRVALLYAWEQRHGEDATYLRLAEAFHRREKIGLIDKLCRRLKEGDRGSSTRDDEGEHSEESEDDYAGRSGIGSSAAASEQPRASLSHQECCRPLTTPCVSQATPTPSISSDTMAALREIETVREDQEDEDEEEIGMFRAHKTLLENSIDGLANMDPEKITTHLKRQGLLDEHDCQIIRHEVTTRDKNTKIIEELQRRGPTAFDTFFKILSSIDEASAEKLLPVKHRILWFMSSPRYAATVTYALDKYFDRDAMLKSERQQTQHGSYLLRKGRIFKRSIPTETLSGDEGSELARLAQDVELYLAFPVSERGNTPRKALMDVFRELGSKMTVAILSGVCVGVRSDGTHGEELGVKGGEVVLATEAVSLDSHKHELPLSSALMEAKTLLSQLPEENKEWFGEAKEKLKELEQASGIPIREHPRLVPHFDTIRQDVQATSADQPRLPRALASDSDTFLFYDLCAQHLGMERPWFSCKGAISHDMLNNVDPTQDPGSVCALMSTFFALEACKTIVDKLRLTGQTFNSRSN